MTEEPRTKLFKGVKCLLTVDPCSNEIVDLYLPYDIWYYLVHRFEGNKMIVTLRSPDDITADMEGSAFLFEGE